MQGYMKQALQSRLEGLGFRVYKVQDLGVWVSVFWGLGFSLLWGG